MSSFHWKPVKKCKHADPQPGVFPLRKTKRSALVFASKTHGGFLPKYEAHHPVATLVKCAGVSYGCSRFSRGGGRAVQTTGMVHRLVGRVFRDRAGWRRDEG